MILLNEHLALNIFRLRSYLFFSSMLSFDTIQTFLNVMLLYKKHQKYSRYFGSGSCSLKYFNDMIIQILVQACCLGMLFRHFLMLCYSTRNIKSRDFGSGSCSLKYFNVMIIHILVQARCPGILFRHFLMLCYSTRNTKSTQYILVQAAAL